MVIDVGNWQNARWALPGGQSGNPASPHYDDQLQRFQASEGIPIPWTPSDVDTSTQHALHLHTAPDIDRPHGWHRLTSVWSGR